MDKEVDPAVLAVINEKRLSGEKRTPVDIIARMGVTDARDKASDQAWLATGGPAGPLGYPTSEETPDASGRRAIEFQHGRIAWTVDAGASIEGSGGGASAAPPPR